MRICCKSIVFVCRSLNSDAPPASVALKTQHRDSQNMKYSCIILKKAIQTEFNVFYNKQQILHRVFFKLSNARLFRYEVNFQSKNVRFISPINRWMGRVWLCFEIFHFYLWIPLKSSELLVNKLCLTRDKILRLGNC